MMSNEEQHNLVQKALDTLSEHFDAGIILVTWQDGGGKTTLTKNISKRFGNFYTINGMVREQILVDETRIIENEKQDDNTESV